jgi:effector-binding domain-containing protein
MACAIHHGPFTSISDAYGALLQWIEANGYRIAGPNRELYLQLSAQAGCQTDPDAVTELQCPVEKASPGVA